MKKLNKNLISMSLDKKGLKKGAMDTCVPMSLKYKGLKKSK